MIDHYRRSELGWEAFFPHYAMAACSGAADTKWSRESGDRKGVGGSWEEGQGGGNGDSKDSSTEGEEQERQCIET